MAGSQKNRPVDPDIEDMRTFAEEHAGPTEPKKADLSGPSVGIEEQSRKKPLEEPDPDQYTPEMQQTDFAHQCLDYVLKRDMPEAVVNVDKIMGRGNSTVRIIGEF